MMMRGGEFNSQYNRLSEKMGHYKVCLLSFLWLHSRADGEDHVAQSQATLQ